jgi:hypothetical protein
LSKFDSKVAAIWGDGVMAKDQVWEQPSVVPPEEDLLVSPKTHFKPIRDYREELPPPLAFLLPLPQVRGIHFIYYSTYYNYDALNG